jgi:hypothetical protein
MWFGGGDQRVRRGGGDESGQLLPESGDICGRVVLVRELVQLRFQVG